MWVAALMWDVAELEGWRCWNIWCLQSCFCYTLFVLILLCHIMLYYILSNLCAYKNSLNSNIILLLHSLLLYLLFSPSGYGFYFVYYLWSYLVFKLIMRISFLILRYMIINTRIWISLFIFEIPDETPCYVRQCLLLMLICLDCLGEQCHIYSILGALWYTTAHLQVP